MNIIIIGYGKMGKMVERLATERGHDVILTINSRNRATEFTVENLKKGDVAIEFSRPETAFENIATCLRAGVPVVSGTTAWLDKLEEAKAICKEENGAFFYASNFSIGVNIFFALSRFLAAKMKPYSEYDVQMEEIHHTQKLDYPSGTAITLSEGIFEKNPGKKGWQAELFGSSAPGSKLPPETLLITSKREKGVPGTHIVSWQSSIDTIEISHTAHTREGFASGALQAAQWLIGKQGFYGMEDMLSESF